MLNKERFLNDICSDIPDKRTREKVKAELRTHIEEKIEDYILCGNAYEEAENKAIADMGDAKRLTRELAEVNSFFPLKRFKNSLMLFYFGLILVSFYLDVWYFKFITTAIGTALLFIACLFLSGSNRLLLAAFLCSIGGTVFSLMNELMPVLPPFAAREALGGIAFALGTVFIIARMFCFGYGIAAFSEGKTAKQAKQCGFLYLAAYGCLGLSILIPEMIVLWIILFVFFIVLILRRIRRVANDVWKHDREVKTRNIGKWGVAAVCVGLSIVWLLPIITSYLLTVTKPRATVYNAIDLSGEQAKRAENIRENFLNVFYHNLKSDTELQEGLNCVLSNVCQSDILRLDTENYTCSFEVANGVFTYNILAFHENGNATVLSLYIYDYASSNTLAVQRVYSVEGCTILQNERNPVRFVQLYTERDKTMQIASSYQYVGTDRVGNEFKRIRGKESQCGYALFDFSGDAVTYSVYCAEQIHFYRSPYNYDDLKSTTRTSGENWRITEVRFKISIII